MSQHSRTLLDTEALSEALKTLPDWALEGGMLARTFTFGSYKEGLVFASAVGWIADRLDHHPDLFIGYQKVRVATITHDAGGLTGLDVELASRVSGL